MIPIKYPTYENVLSTITGAMVDNNDALIKNVALDDTRGWLTTKGTITMGYFPRGDNAPNFWNPTNMWTTSPDVPFTTNTRYWEIITPWFVTSKGVNDASSNTLINISGITIQLYDKTINAWRNLDTAGGNPTWGNYKDYSNKGNVDHGAAAYRLESDGSRSFRLRNDWAAVHGGSIKFAFLDSVASQADIGGVFVKLRAKLVVDNVNGVDDRYDAQVLIDVGADLWPDATATLASMGIGFLPNVGISRFRLVTPRPQEFYMTAISPPNSVGHSTYYLGGGEVTMPKANFESHWPPYI